MTLIAKSKPVERRETLWDNVKTLLIALIIALGVRTVLVQPFRIPSGSMQPTMLVGDYMIVSKWSYGYSRFSTGLPFGVGGDGRIFASEPARGDVVVFRPPGEPDKDFVKRLVGLPGDRIQIRAGRLFLNGQAVEREFLRMQDFREASGEFTQVAVYRETLPDGGPSYQTFDRFPDNPLDDTGVFEVPEGHYFMMGDDRDNSSDSRDPTGVVGFVPHDHLIGKTRIVFASFDPSTSILQPWTLFTGFRGSRFLKGVE